MPDIVEEKSDNASGFDPLIQTENIAFRPDEMVSCSSCRRMNPPNRLNCLYCGNELEIKPENVASIRPNLRKLEAWKPGFNIISREPLPANQLSFADIASFLSTDPGDLALIFEAAEPLPLARVESKTEAEILVAGLAERGLKCSIVADNDLADDTQPVRLSRIDIRHGGIAVTDFNTREVTEIDDDNLALLIPGIVAVSTVDSFEKKGRAGKTRVIDETTTDRDESVLDLYSRQDPIGFRVHLTGFDFSCLGADKGLIADQNMQRLTTVLAEHAPHVRLAGNYKKVRRALDQVWEIESRREPTGLQRSGFAKRNFGSVASTSNLRQFTKYSRLQWHLL